MIRIELVTDFLTWMIVTSAGVTFAFQCFLLLRRVRRERYFAGKDVARARYTHPLEAYLTGGMELVEVLRRLTPMSTPAERDVVVEISHRFRAEPAGGRRSRLLWRTGHVLRWAEKTFGRRRGRQLVDLAFGRSLKTPPARSLFNRWVARLLWSSRIFSVPRALALHELGQLSPVHASVFLADALLDPSMMVRRLAVESMGENRYPQAIPLLLEELRRAVEEGNDISLRTIKSALVRYEIADMEPFLPFFEHSTQRMRFFVIDTLREICQRAAGDTLLGAESFSAEMRRVVEERCCRDEFADVRARAAGVVRHFRDSHAIAALHRLLQDENEFVRMHAVRACTHQFYRALLPELRLRLTDPRWRVREAAVRTMITLAPQGLEQLYQFFAATQDRYASEQIAEELENRGLIKSLVEVLASGTRATQLPLRVCGKLLQMGYTSMLITELGKVTRTELRISFIEALRMAPEKEFMAVLREIAEPHPEAEHAGVLQLLYRRPAPELDLTRGTMGCD